MRIKQHHSKQVSGIPSASAVVASGEDGQMRTVNIFVSAHDAMDIKTVIFSLRLSPDEAIALAAQLTKHASGRLA